MLRWILNRASSLLQVFISAPIAQLVEHLICNQGVRGSSPCGGTIFTNIISNLAILSFPVHRQEFIQ